MGLALPPVNVRTHSLAALSAQRNMKKAAQCVGRLLRCYLSDRCQVWDAELCHLAGFDGWSRLRDLDLFRTAQLLQNRGEILT